MNIETLLKELSFKAIRSSGAGGQHVNKTASKVEVTFSVSNSEAISDREKIRVTEKLKNRITSEGNIILQSGKTRSQHKNKAIVIKRLIDLIEKSLIKAKPRRKTKPSRGSIEKRLTSKRNQALKKNNRKNPKID
ncbi:MAG: ribosome-associated protein [Flavobacteriaceae bacterium]|jgi:ribosome-associated protein|uniref:alternative ribosome rescue aminoacyl-tRNA hydrolase ArfB n=1 Tax=Candidatus Marifrigoribacter sp. Uisw_064 TaxID=3230970 RepID=UPI003ADCAD58